MSESVTPDQITNLRVLAEVVSDGLEEGSFRNGYLALTCAALARVFPEHRQTRDRCAECTDVERENCEHCPTAEQYAEADRLLGAWVRQNAPHLASLQPVEA